MSTYKYEILSGIPPEEIEAYFKRISKEYRPPNTFCGEGWTVELERLFPIKNRIIIIPSTRITFTGDESVCTKLIYTYRKKFMRGGG